MATEDKIKLVLKGILFYATFIIAILYIAGVDSIYDNGYFVEMTLLVAALIYACYKTISEEEMNIFLLSKYLDKDEEDEW